MARTPSLGLPGTRMTDPMLLAGGVAEAQGRYRELRRKSSLAIPPSERQQAALVRKTQSPTPPVRGQERPGEMAINLPAEFPCRG